MNLLYIFGSELKNIFHFVAVFGREEIMMWLIWLCMLVISSISGIISSRRYRQSCPGQRGSVTFYHVIAALNYILFVCGLLMMGWYVLALGYIDVWVIVLQVLVCVMSVGIALSALRKVARILKETGVQLTKRRLPQQT